jgi:hypothetical protein
MYKIIIIKIININKNKIIKIIIKITKQFLGIHTGAA